MWVTVDVLVKCKILCKKDYAILIKKLSYISVVLSLKVAFSQTFTSRYMSLCIISLRSPRVNISGHLTSFRTLQTVRLSPFILTRLSCSLSCTAAPLCGRTISRAHRGCSTLQQWHLDCARIGRSLYLPVLCVACLLTLVYSLWKWKSVWRRGQCVQGKPA